VGVYRNLWVDASAFVPRATNGSDPGTVELTSNCIMMDYQDFDKDTEQAAQAKVTMPDEWDLGNIKVKHKWTNGETGGSGSVVWGTKARAVSNDEALDGSWGTRVDVTDAFTTDGDLLESGASAAITIGNTPAMSDLIILEVSRVVSASADVYDKTARHLGCVIQYKEASSTVTEW